MARSIWSGSISFGLVTIPVKTYSAIRGHDVHFHLVAPDGSRVRNQRVSEKSGKVVEYSKLKKGYETSKGKYAIFDQDELEELAPPSTKTIDIEGFVPLEDIDPIFFERTYHEVVPRSDITDVPKRRAKVTGRERALAEQIVESLESTWKPERYHDDHEEELRRRIKAKQKGTLESVEEEDEAPQGAKVVDLMEALQASLDRTAGRRRATKKSTRTRSRSSATKKSGTAGTAAKAAKRTGRRRTATRARSRRAS